MTEKATVLLDDKYSRMIAQFYENRQLLFKGKAGANEDREHKMDRGREMVCSRCRGFS